MFNNYNNFNNCCDVVSTECCMSDPVYETPVENCIQKDYIHEVVHICPVHTKIVNSHIYKHTYKPEYTCSEENVCTNINECCSNNFMN